MLLTLVDLFQRIEKRQKEYQWQVLMSYVEIYNERLFDLLVEHSEELELRDDGHGQALVVGATVVPINSPQEVKMLVKKRLDMPDMPTKQNFLSRLP